MLYNPLNKQQLKNLLHTCLVIAVLGVSLSAIGFLIKNSDFHIMIVVVFSVLLSSLLILYVIIWIIGQFRCEFHDEEIWLLWREKCYQRVPYSEVKGITICGAVNYAFYPIVNSDKKQIAITSLYRESHIATMRISPNATSRFPYGEDYCICRTEINPEDLALIMRRSRATVFVTQEIFSLYTSEMTNLFRSFPMEQVMISHWQLGCDRPVLSTYEKYYREKRNKT